MFGDKEYVGEEAFSPEEAKNYLYDDIDVIPEPPTHILSFDADMIDDENAKRINELHVEKLIQSLKEVNDTITRKVDALESLDVSVYIVEFKIFEATQQFKSKLKQMKDEREQLLVSIENKSELSLILHDLDKKISDVEMELDAKIKEFNCEKIELQEKGEAIIFQLDDDLPYMQERLRELQNEIEGIKRTVHTAQFIIINKKYAPILQDFQEAMLTYEKLHMNEWKIEHSELKLTTLLEKKGLTFTSSGKLATLSGTSITFQEAHDKGYFADVRVSLEKIVQFFKERDQQQHILAQIGTVDSTTYECSSIESRMSTEDVKYLKQYVGKPLTLGLAEVLAKQPRDPIHYLGHWLFKYRYNQELEEIQKKEVDELTHQRKLLAQERWKKFVEEEARAAVLDMILRAEQIALENELRRIEREQMLALEEEEEEGNENDYENLEAQQLLEEAKDKFE